MIFNLILCLSIVIIYLLTRIGRRDKKTKDKLFLIITFILLFIVVASREMTVGNDTSSYLKLFDECNTYKWEILETNNYFERGYLAFNVILSYLNISPRIFLCVIALIFSVSIYKFIKDNSSNYLMSVLMFINLLFLYQSMNIMRQFLALSIILFFGLKFIKEKKLLKFILTVALATLFHFSALVAVFIYPIYHLKYNRTRVTIIIVCSIVGAILLGQIYPFVASIIGKEAYYLEMVGEAKLGNTISTLIFLAMYIFALFVVKQDKRQKYSFYLYSLLFAAAIYFVSINMAVFARVSQYYAILSIVALPNIIEENIKESRMVVESTIIGLFMLYSSIIMVNKPEWNSAYNYKTCLIPEREYICE